jgi:prolipoprotein diacylglyceryltransferase
VKENLLKTRFFIYLTVLATLIGARLGHFYDWEYYRNHLSEIILPFRFTQILNLQDIKVGKSWAAISIIVAMYFTAKNVLRRPQLWILDRVIPVASGAIFVRLGNFLIQKL